MDIRGKYQYGIINKLKGREPEWPNPKVNVENCLKKLKNGLKITYSTKLLKIPKM